MRGTVLEKTVIDKFNDISKDNKTIIVLKGISINLLVDDYNPVYLENIVENKLRYFLDEIVNKRQVITYEEFLVLYPFVLEQYSKVVVLVNNVYINQYPIDIALKEATIQGLITHFNESENEYDDSFVGDIDEIIALFNGVQDNHGRLVGSYCEDIIPINNKIKRVNLFDHSEDQISTTVCAKESFFELETELDYVRLSEYIFSDPKEVTIRFNNYTHDINGLIYHLEIIKSNWNQITNVHLVQRNLEKETFEHRDEYNEILKKYWGYDSFLDIEVYDNNKLDKDIKETIKVSQEQIISNLVTQAERAINPSESSRDIFVTAPTGAGKSAMFQVPAIYLAEKYNLLTIVISPLIGLMNDQVDNLEKRNYKGAKTINSDISPIIKQEIIENVSSGEIDILYLSPESLLARSDVEQLIGDRTIGMIIIDEAHIVTTWGKQFRPDYWYLGEHIRKLRTKQMKTKGKSFVIGTFTATAIYHGIEDMFEETRNSLNLIDPITYLGYIKRDDIKIVIDKPNQSKNKKTEYELDKFNQIIDIIKRAQITNKKTLIYFPTVKLIDRCWEYLLSQQMASVVSKYHGKLSKTTKEESYRRFKSGEKFVMLATKAFGMGIDIDDIEIVVHFAPTGNVCDYVQEIGRAARNKNLIGEAYYCYNSRDFKFINMLHGLSSIKKYQIVEVIQKIYELYEMNLKNNQGFTKKRNAMLIDAENFSYIFGGSLNETDDNINKVKTALLIIQKDYESIIGYSPITVRPIPLFSIGYFSIDPSVQKKLNTRFRGSVKLINETLNICKVNLQLIWEKIGKQTSFPQFKYLIYSKSNELDFNNKYPMDSVVTAKIELDEYHKINFKKYWEVIKQLAHESVVTQEYISIDTFVDRLCQRCNISVYRAHSICDVVFASINTYRRYFSRTTSSIYQKKELRDNTVKYQFKSSIESFFTWVEKQYNYIVEKVVDDHLYLINKGDNRAKEISTILGILEVLDVLKFEMSGGANSQLYIYINQIRVLQNVINNPKYYRNRLLDTVYERHLLSVRMLTYIYENYVSSEKTWEILEDYFLGRIPDVVTQTLLEDKINNQKDLM